jgi:hypothetical protein
MEVTKNSCWELAKRIKYDVQKRRNAVIGFMVTIAYHCTG